MDGNILLGIHAVTVLTLCINSQEVLQRRIVAIFCTTTGLLQMLDRRTHNYLQKKVTSSLSLYLEESLTHRFPVLEAFNFIFGAIRYTLSFIPGKVNYSSFQQRPLLNPLR
jgi:hypothetical protein